MIDFRDKVVVITGAARGIGKAIATELISEGAILVLTDINEKQLKECAEELKAMGSKKIYHYVCDIADENSCLDLATYISNQIGPVSLLCAHAGIGVPGGITQISKNNRLWALDVNISGMMNVIYAFLPGMQVESEGERHIMLTASMASFLRPQQHMGFYAMTKYAILGMAESLRADLSGSGITASVLCPGLVNTRIWASVENRQVEYGGVREVDEDIGKPWEIGLEPRFVAKMALAGLRANDFFIFVPCEERDDEESFSARLDELKQAFETSMERYRRQSAMTQKGRTQKTGTQKNGTPTSKTASPTD